MRHIAHPQADEITAAQFAVDCQIEHREISCRMRVLQVNPDSPDVSLFEGWFLTDKLAFVPCVTLLDTAHDRLLGC